MRNQSNLLPKAFITIGITLLAVFPIYPQEITQRESSAIVQADQMASKIKNEVQPIRTDSPRKTLETFKRLRNEYETSINNYLRSPTRTKSNQAALILDQFVALIDLSSVPRASREEVGKQTVGYILDILGRIEEPDLQAAPNAESLQDEKGAVSWRIPNTPIRIDRIDEGTRDGEYLFSKRTVRIVPRFYQQIENLPLRSDLGITSWSRTFPQLTGPLIPWSLVAALPDGLKDTWLSTPIWKIFTVILMTVVAVIALGFWFRLVERMKPEGGIREQLWNLLMPSAIIAVMIALNSFFAYELNISGGFSRIVDLFKTLLQYFAFAWIFWLFVRIVFEWIILSPRINDQSVDAKFLRLIADIIGAVGIILILAVGGQELGLPVLSLLAGLGIGGLAIALAIRPTLENLIGGFVLYLDRPIQVGDFCSFGGQKGTVESIGIRSTQIRAIDRTQISIPNAKFADMDIVNWSRRDQILIQETIGVRYETKPDQLRYLLVELRKMLHAHPRFDSDTVRVRFAGYGDSALKIDIRVYARTREINEFVAIREDVFMRIYDVVTKAGSGFAFPSSTVYLGRDDGLDKKLTEEAIDKVEQWRRSAELPFPRLPTEYLEKIEDTLDYPPTGSPDAQLDIFQESLHIDY
ncbi:MAG: mechanosensitive ion channel family protein, partial [Desulfobulbia bacterium]